MKVTSPILRVTSGLIYDQRIFIQLAGVPRGTSCLYHPQVHCSRRIVARAVFTRLYAKKRACVLRVCCSLISDCTVFVVGPAALATDLTVFLGSIVGREVSIIMRCIHVYSMCRVMGVHCR